MRIRNSVANVFVIRSSLRVCFVLERSLRIHQSLSLKILRHLHGIETFLVPGILNLATALALLRRFDAGSHPFAGLVMSRTLRQRLSRASSAD